MYTLFPVNIFFVYFLFFVVIALLYHSDGILFLFHSIGTTVVIVVSRKMFVLSINSEHGKSN